MFTFGSLPLAQVAMVVNDIEVAKAKYAQLLGVEVPPTIETAPGSEVRMTYRGAPSDARAKLAFFNLPNIQLELIEPIGPESSWHEGLPEHGERLHHIAWWVDDAAAAQTALEAVGASLIHRGDMGDGQYAYFDARSTMGVTIELLEKVRTELRVDA
jgi:catechol 2,3-dioxygenase-like lactoylglutathione lyase family enzyme